MKSKWYKSILYLSAVAVLGYGVLSACATNKKTKSKADFSSVVGREWRAKSIAGTAITEAWPTLKFSEEKLSGQTTCNRMSASYHAEGENITIGNIKATKMLCENRTVEENYLNALSQVKKWSVKRQQLYFLDADGKELLVFSEIKH